MTNTLFVMMHHHRLWGMTTCRPAVGRLHFSRTMLPRRAVATAAIEYRQRLVHREAFHNPESYWREMAKDVAWIMPPKTILDSSQPPIFRWYPDGQLNTCFNAVDRHVAAGHGSRVAIYYDSPVTQQQEAITFAQLQDHVAKVAGVLAAHGVQKGDRVVIYMPMVPEAIFGMLACARIGAIHSVVFGGFAAKELSKRIQDATPKLILSASCGIEGSKAIPYKPLLDEAIKLSSHKPVASIILQRPRQTCQLGPRDYDWASECAKASPHDCVPVKSTDPLYILFTSGTTGRPKGILRDNGGHCVALKRSMGFMYDVNPGDVFWAASDIGWVVGHSYIVYAPLFHGCSTVLYEGKPIGTPDAGAFWRVCDQYNVRVLSMAPTALRALKREDPNGDFVRKYPMRNLASMFLAGERCDPDTLLWAQKILQRPVIDHWWMTELGSPATGLARSLQTLDSKPGSCGLAVPGFNFAILDEKGNEVPCPIDPEHTRKPISIDTNTKTTASSDEMGDYEMDPRHTHDAVAAGNIVLKLPLPPGALPTLWMNDEGYVKSYLSRFPGYFDTGDAGFVDSEGFLSVMSRADDIINVAGHRLSTGTLEEVLTAMPEVAECAVVAARDQLKGMKPFGFIVLKTGTSVDEIDVCDRAINNVRAQVGAFACFERCIVVPRVPKTRSGKILRRTLRAIVNGDEYEVPPTIDDPAVLTEVTEAFTKRFPEPIISKL